VPTSAVASALAAVSRLQLAVVIVRPPFVVLSGETRRLNPFAQSRSLDSADLATCSLLLR